MSPKTSVGLFACLLTLTVSACGLVLSELPQRTPAKHAISTKADTAATLATRDDASLPSDDVSDTFSICGPNSSPPEDVASSQIKDLIKTGYIDSMFQLATASARDLPGIVKLEPERDLNATDVITGHCSATRIEPNWFITAAHCVAEDYDRIILKVGSEQLSSHDIRRVEADYAVCHGSFRGNITDYANDLALVHVSDDKLPELRDVPVISWGATSMPFQKSSFDVARVGGWGLMSSGGELADFLQKEELTIRDIRPDTIRLMSRMGRGPCIGDSGGPLMVEDNGHPVMMGVLSTLGVSRNGTICSGDYLASYINLETQKDWIMTTMATCEVNAALCRRF